MEELGYEVTRNFGGYGVVATLRRGVGRSVMLRADMDALPIGEETLLDYASGTPGVMHACGHDGHTAMLMGAAEQLVKLKELRGTVHLLFQPAEEAMRNSGAQQMLAEGLFERFPCEAIFGMHNHPGVELGKFLIAPGAFMAASDRAVIQIQGKSGHAARPHLALDPIVMAASLVMALQTIVARNVNPTQTAVVTVGYLHAGRAVNAIAESAEMGLSIRSFDEDVRDQLQTRITDLARSHVQSFGGTAEVQYQRGYPVLVNSESETLFAKKIAEDLVGNENVLFPFPPVAGSEDFSFYLREKPGCFFRLGIGQDRPMLHSSKYDFNDNAHAIGAAFWTRLAQAYLNG